MSANSACSQPFHDIQNFFNRELAEEVQVKDGSTVFRWLQTAFEAHRDTLRRELHQQAISKVHLSFDVWQSHGGKKGVLGIVSHYANLEGCLVTRPLAIRRVVGRHTAENMLKHLVSTIDEFNLRDRLGFFTLDNHSANDRTLNLLFQLLNPMLDDCEIENEVANRRVRCWGHVINIVASDFLYTTSPDRGKSMAIDVIERAHKFNAFVRYNPQRRDLWRKVKRQVENINGESLADDDDFVGLADMGFDTLLERIIERSNAEASDESVAMLRVHGETRWNSVLAEFSSTLKDREAVDQFTFTSGREGHSRVPKDCSFALEDWKALEFCAELLEPFRSHTIFHEGNTIRLPSVKASSIELGAHLKNCLARMDPNVQSEVRVCFNSFSLLFNSFSLLILVWDRPTPRITTQRLHPKLFLNAFSDILNTAAR
jgi:hypothetical protein